MAITLKNAASDLAAALNGQTVGGVALVSGQNLFWRANHPDGWSLSVQLRNTGGQAPEPYINGSSPQAVFRAGVQVLVYGVPGEDGFDAAETLARGVLGFLQQATVSGYVQIMLVSATLGELERRDE